MRWIRDMLRRLWGPVVVVKDGDVLDLSGSKGTFRVGITVEEGGTVVLGE